MEENMPLLTVEAVRENPWNVVTHVLPAHPGPLLLAVAQLAADYCGGSEYLLMQAARDGSYIPPEWRSIGSQPDLRGASEGRAEEADHKLNEIYNICARDYGVIVIR
jgi:hypothetical protein